MSGVSLCLSRSVSLPAFDMHCPVCTLPHAFGTRLDTIPAPVSYLPAAPKTRVRDWEQRLQDRLGPAGKPRVGLVWSFFFSSRRRHTRSLRDWSSDVCSSDLIASRWRAAGRAGARSSGRSRSAWCAIWSSKFRFRNDPELEEAAHLHARGALVHGARSEEHTSELQSRRDLVCRLLLEKKKKNR